MSLNKIKTLATVSNALIIGIMEGAPLSTEKKDELINRVNLSWDEIKDIHARTSILTVHRLWNDLIQATQDDFVGIHIGLNTPGERFGLAAHAAQNSETFQQTLGRLEKYSRLINDLMRCELTIKEAQAHFSIKFLWDVLSLERHAVDISFACIQTWANQHLNAPLTLSEVRFKHSFQSAKERYHSIFNCPVILGAKTNELIFDAAFLNSKVKGVSSDLGLFLDHYANTELLNIPVLGNFPERVHQILIRELKQGNFIDLAEISTELKIAPRQIQRRLKESSTSFSELLDSARKILAAQLLAAPDANVEQVGFKLGYSESTAFIRAFKKWYQQTPGEFRRDLLSKPKA